jgi:hypothetical protein
MGEKEIITIDTFFLGWVKYYIILAGYSFYPITAISNCKIILALFNDSSMNNYKNVMQKCPSNVKLKTIPIFQFSLKSIDGLEVTYCT